MARIGVSEQRLLKNGVERAWMMVGALLLVLLSSACGGSSGGDANDVSFSGTVRDGLPADSSARELAGVEVCALGSCSVSDVSGFWSFMVPEESFSGGSVAFTLTGQGIAAETLVTGLNMNADNVAIDFLMEGDGSVSIVTISQDGVLTFDVNAPTPDDDVPPSDSEQACQLLDSSNIVITDQETMISVSNSAAECPMALPSAFNVANPGVVPFEYVVTVDLASLSLAPTGGFLMPGEIATHDIAYLCTEEMSFDTVVNASVSVYQLDDGTVISAEDAIAQCGAGASAGNTVDSFDIMVEVQP